MSEQFEVVLLSTVAYRKTNDYEIYYEKKVDMTDK